MLNCGHFFLCRCTHPYLQHRERKIQTGEENSSEGCWLECCRHCVQVIYSLWSLLELYDLPLVVFLELQHFVLFFCSPDGNYLIYSSWSDCGECFALKLFCHLLLDTQTKFHVFVVKHLCHSRNVSFSAFVQYPRRPRDARSVAYVSARPLQLLYVLAHVLVGQQGNPWRVSENRTTVVPRFVVMKVLLRG